MADMQSNKALVKSFLTAPLDEKMDFVVDEVHWHLPASVAERRGGDALLRGEEVHDLFLRSADTYEQNQTWDWHHVIAEADLVAVHGTMHCTTKAGNDYHGDYHMLFRVEGDRIAETWEFLDTAYLFGLPQPAHGAGSAG